MGQDPDPGCQGAIFRMETRKERGVCVAGLLLSPPAFFFFLFPYWALFCFHNTTRALGVCKSIVEYLVGVACPDRAGRQGRRLWAGGEPTEVAWPAPGLETPPGISRSRLARS